MVILSIQSYYFVAIQKNAKIELKNNESEQERQKGTPVLYGSTIQVSTLF